MQFYNTLTRQLAPLVPIKPGEVSLYTCGPTVYDYVHIGNLRAFLFDDSLRRTLEAGGYHVRHVMNVTDVGHLVSDADEGEDKLEKGAAREGKTVREVADSYTDAFKADMAALNILSPNAYHDEHYDDTYARATQFIESQIAMVQTLIERGHAYVTEQAIYFDVTSVDDYSALSGQRLADKEVGARSDVVVDSAKHHPSDFAIWFFTVGHFVDHAMHWPSPWGDGFPGWHLECSAIIHELLGDPIDIHTGGVDHIGTHHTNEIAQTKGAFGHELAHLWMHNEFVLVDGGKMAKSKGNGYTLAEIERRGFSPMAFRLLTLQAHYRSELNFTWSSLEAAQTTLGNIYAWADLVHQPEHVAQTENVELGSLFGSIQASFEDDLDTPAALALLFGLMEQSLAQEQLKTALEKLEALFGLGLTDRADIDTDIRRLMADRQTARDSKDWTTSDRLRDELMTAGIEIDDTPRGPRWRRTLS